MHTNFSQTLLKDHFLANGLPEHSLIMWTDGPLPPLPAPGNVQTAAAAASASAGGGQAPGVDATRMNQQMQ